MYNYLISEYIKKLEVKDILEYGLKNNISVSPHDALILLQYAKNHYKTFMYDDPKHLFKELKKQIDPNTYKEVYKLYVINKSKYLR